MNFWTKSNSTTHKKYLDCIEFLILKTFVNFTILFNEIQYIFGPQLSASPITLEWHLLFNRLLHTWVGALKGYDPVFGTH